MKKILGSFSYPYNRRIAGAHGNFSMRDYGCWLETVEEDELARALCRLAQLNQSKVYLFWGDLQRVYGGEPLRSCLESVSLNS